MEINFRPSILDNVDQWKVFKDDEQLLRFIHNIQEFEGGKISYQKEGKKYQECEDNVRNHIPSSLIAFENLFNRQDHHKKQKESIKFGDYMEINGLADKLEVVASTLQPSDEMISGNGKMEIKFQTFNSR